MAATQPASPPRPRSIAFLGGVAIVFGLVSGIASAVGPADLRTPLSWTAWLGAAGLGGIVTVLGVRAAAPGRERWMRRWLSVSYALGAAWAFCLGAIRLAGYVDTPTPADVLLAGAVGAGLFPFVELVRGLPRADRIALALDLCCAFLAICALTAAALAVVTDTHGMVLWVSSYPIAFLCFAAFASMLLIATQAPFRARGLALALTGLAGLCVAVFGWAAAWIVRPGTSELAPAVLAVSAPVIALGIALAGREFRADLPLIRRRVWYVDAIPLAAVALVGLLLLAESAGGLVLPMVRFLTVLVVAVAIAREAFLLGARTSLVRRLLEADAQTQEALRRAATAEELARERADRLAAVLEATGGMTLADDRVAELGRVLEALTPRGATSFLLLVHDDEFEVAAASGPLAPPLGPIERRSHGIPPTAASPEGRLTYFSASGRTQAGVALSQEQVGPLGADVAAAIGIQLVAHDGSRVGALHVFEPASERILEPAYIGLAQLVAAHVAVAVENRALLDRLQHELDEVQRVQAELVQATKLGAVAELAAAVAHEVNNPLTGILGFSDLLLTELPAGDPRRDEVAVIRSEAIRAREIVRALLELARPRAPKRAPTDLNELTRSCVDLLRYRIEETGVWVADDYHDLPSVDVDPDAMRQVLLNLLNNAVSAMPGGGELRIATRLLGDTVTVSIADDGIGMDEETRKAIFTPFFTMRPGSAGGVSGGGLGLAVSYQIVQSHGGTIGVESAVGMGSMFTIELPVDPAAVRGDAATEPLVGAVSRRGERPAREAEAAPRAGEAS